MKTNLIQISFLFFISCSIGTDIIDDYVKPTLKIGGMTNISTLKVGESHQFKLEYTNSIGEKSQAKVTWKSDKPDIISITESGKATAHKKGAATLTATASDASISIKVEAADKTKVVEEVNERKATIKKINYSISGTAILKLENGKLTLTLLDDFSVSSLPPDVWVYLSNNKSRPIKEDLKIEMITKKSGKQVFDLTKHNIKISDFKYVFFHCVSAGSPVGYGELKP